MLAYRVWYVARTNQIVWGMWRGVSGPVVRALDSGLDGPGSSPGWGTTLWP